ncbi:hypothetical protein PF010_g6217 [Phytophthora fragariae]|uniref:Uncharacterized protein n=1 Tax=Phytophthora fragariae TaxID=53985 RepID=A0A6G0LM02_9STRA|nr:hypothetical protein PF003_g16598 [Phytophthora fragariae]KAE9123856.1 hypothetical protein PF010_g6217 [Phytophthora fragariae]
MSRILGQNVAEDAQTILAKRTTARMAISRATRRRRVSAAEKKERDQQDMAVPNHTVSCA